VHQFIEKVTVSAPQLESFLAARLQEVERRILAACQRAGRSRSEVTLLAVTKTVSIDVAAALIHLGVCNLGENRPQELWRKAVTLPQTVDWHLIGHLQRNKIDRTLPLVRLIHSVDNLRLLLALEQAAASKPVPVLLEINASRESTKHGFQPEELPNLKAHLQALQAVQIRGLMTMAAYEADAERCRPTFALLRGLRDRLRGELSAPHSLEHLSMGMSNDFEVAIEEGATFVRLGTILFEGLS
jgi:pyridoxal phosphate enzyme (YggS family)